MNKNFISIAHPAVFIFGAGATRGGMLESIFPPPIDNDFFDIAKQLKGHGTPKLAKRVLQSVWELYGTTNGISLEEYYREIETRALIGRFAKSANQPKNWKKRQGDLEELVRRVYIHTTCKAIGTRMEPLKSDIHQKILQNLRDGDTLITFNYDLVIEEAFSSAKLWNPIDGYGVGVQGKSFDWCRLWLKKRNVKASNVKESRVQLLKLHGSLNWMLYPNQGIKLKSRPYYVRTKNKNPTFEKISVLPPGWNKRIDHNPYKLFWRASRLKLDQCKSLIILGYSLPETDLLAHSLFAEVVRLRYTRKKFLKEFHIADPSNEVKNRFIRLFNPALGAFGKVFQYQDIKEFTDKNL